MAKLLQLLHSHRRLRPLRLRRPRRFPQPLHLPRLHRRRRALRRAPRRRRRCRPWPARSRPTCPSRVARPASASTTSAVSTPVRQTTVGFRSRPSSRQAGETGTAPPGRLASHPTERSRSGAAATAAVRTRESMCLTSPRACGRGWGRETLSRPTTQPNSTPSTTTTTTTATASCRRCTHTTNRRTCRRTCQVPGPRGPGCCPNW